MHILLLLFSLSVQAAEWPRELRGDYFGFPMREANRPFPPASSGFELRVGADELRLTFPPDADDRRWSVSYDADEFEIIDGANCFFAKNARPPLRICFGQGLGTIVGGPPVTVQYGEHPYDPLVARLYRRSRWNEFRARRLYSRMAAPELQPSYVLKKLDAARFELARQTHAKDEIEKLLLESTAALEFRTPADLATATRIFHAALLDWRDEWLALRALEAIKKKPLAFALGVLGDLVEKLDTGYSSKVMTAAAEAAKAVLARARAVGEARARLFARYRHDGLDGIYEATHGKVIGADRDAVLELLQARGQIWSAYERIRLLNAVKVVPRSMAVPADIAAKFIALYDQDIDQSHSSLKKLCEAAIGE